MDVILYAPCVHGHSFIYTSRVTDELARRGVHVSVFPILAQSSNDKSRVPMLKRLPLYMSDRASYSVFPERLMEITFGLGSMLGQSVMLSRFHEAISGKSRRHAVVHFLAGNPMVLGSPIKRLSIEGFPIVVTVHNCDYGRGNRSDSLIRRTYKTIARNCMRQIYEIADAICVHGDAQKEMLMETTLQGKDSLAKVHVVDYGTDVCNYVKMDCGEARRILGLPSGIKLVLFFGAIRPEKRLPFLVTALSKCSSDIHLLVAGEPMGERMDSLRDLADEVGVSERVHLRLGYIPEDQIPLLYSASNVLAVPYEEGYGGNSGPLHLAFTYRLPVVVSDTGQIGLLTRKLNIGVTFPPASVDGLRVAIEEVVNAGTAVYQDWIDALEKASTDHSWSKMAERYVKVYSTVVDGRALRSAASDRESI